MGKQAGFTENARRKAQIHELITVSYHEAGHVIYGLLHFMKIDQAFLFESKTIKGRINGLTHFDSILNPGELFDSDLIAGRVNAEVCMHYAGLVAEKHLFKMTSGSDKFPLFLKDGSEDDIYEVAQMIKKHNLALPGKKRYAYKKKLMKETLSELQNNWKAVSLVAHVLFEKKKINFLELKELLTKKSADKEFWKEQFKTINYIFDNRDTLDEKKLKSILLI